MLKLQLIQKSVLWFSHLACYHSNASLEEASFHMPSSLSWYLLFLTWIESRDFSEGWRQERARGLGTVLMQRASRRDWRFSGPESLASIQRRASVRPCSIHKRNRLSVYDLTHFLQEWERNREKDREKGKGQGGGRMRDREEKDKREREKCKAVGRDEEKCYEFILFYSFI